MSLLFACASVDSIVLLADDGLAYLALTSKTNYVSRGALPIKWRPFNGTSHWNSKSRELAIDEQFREIKLKVKV